MSEAATRGFPAVSGKNFRGKFEEENEETGEIELSLGLSLNGRFGVDPMENKLKRSSSIPEFMNMKAVKEEESGSLVSAAMAPLVRTYSLPTETEEEVRKRKELQSLRRMEAKRKRFEKQRNAKASRDQREGANANNGRLLQDQCVKVLSEFSAMRMPSSVPASSYGVELNGNKNSPETESTTTSIHSPETKQKHTENSGDFTGVRTEKESNSGKEMGRKMMEEMPCVSTKGEGPNGKRIEGFLYRFRKGEDVRILCVCHGSFLTPAEFVKHAGGGDVAHPLKHIVVTPSFL